jgi:hypothetical protein
MKDVLDEALTAISDVREDIAADVGGITSCRIRALLNFLARHLPPDEAYLEVGIHIGGTLISALDGNRSVRAYACDDWSYTYSSHGNPKDVFLSNLGRHRDRLPNITVIESDAFRMLEGAPFDRPIGAYFYDGGHSEDQQRLAVVKAAPHLARESFMVVDDFGWAPVSNGTWAGILEVGFRGVHFKAFLPEDADDKRWNNGIGIFHLSK